nr:E4 control protein orf3/4 [Human mastadenovirus C]UOQ22485.1 E4 control protein orf3/4 [Human mastadenovirus C]UOQ22531.1 E4 control protein orf3/4 [Human mastadenovirus C]
MIRCLRLKVEGALEQIFTMAGLNIRDLLRDILRRKYDYVRRSIWHDTATNTISVVSAHSVQ